jgi:hypothetical protein
MGNFSEDPENFSLGSPREERFSENGLKLPHEDKSSPKVVTAPSSWTVDGLEIEYMPEGE